MSTVDFTWSLATIVVFAVLVLAIGIGLQELEDWRRGRAQKRQLAEWQRRQRS